VNGFAVGGGNVLQVVCDLTIAKASAIFRQVGPSMGSYDAGYGTWYLEDLVGRKRAKEIWFSNEKMTAEYAREIGLINRVVPDDQLVEATRGWATDIASRGSHALNAIKASFTARTAGVAGMSRITHDLLMPYYLQTEESQELGASFRDHREPDPDKFGN
jgi:naphthoate synthase